MKALRIKARKTIFTNRKTQEVYLPNHSKREAKLVSTSLFADAKLQGDKSKI